MAISKQPKTRLVVDLDPEQHAQIRERAKRSRLTLSNYVRRALRLPLDIGGKRKDLIEKA